MSDTTTERETPEAPDAEAREAEAPGPEAPGPEAPEPEAPADEVVGYDQMQNAIEVRGVSKEFSLHYQNTVRKLVVAKSKGLDTHERFWALRNIDFDVKQGESIGLMGLNGSGKSTLLKLVMGVMKPNVGTVRTRGRVSGLIATGAGFHPEMTGIENIYMNAAILGMSKEETDAKFDDIASFADLGKFLDSPVGQYSSGMNARLGFAVAVNVDCDIFIADEVLAVGDQPFKKKCIERMEEVRDSGVTMFYVSHSVGSVQRMCERVLVLQKGELNFDGDVDEGVAFLKYDEQEPGEGRKAARKAKRRARRAAEAAAEQAEVAAAGRARRDEESFGADI